MEGNPVIKVSVAELAGKFKDHCVSSCTDVKKPVRRRPPRTLQIPAKGDESQGEAQKAEASAHPARSRNRNSALIEKLQAGLALRPEALLPSPKSPREKPQPPGFSLDCPSCPVAPPEADKQEGEAMASFESPADSTLLPSINKSRARLSVRRRPPSRRGKRPGEEGGAEEGSSSSPAECAAGGTANTHTHTHTRLPRAPDLHTQTSTAEPQAETKLETQQEVSRTADQQEVSRTADQQEVSSTVDQQEVRRTADQQEVRRTADQQEVRRTADQQEVSSTVDQQEVSRTADQKEVGSAGDQQEVSRTADQKEVGSAGDQQEVGNIAVQQGCAGKMSTVSEEAAKDPTESVREDTSGAAEALQQTAQTACVDSGRSRDALQN